MLGACQGRGGVSPVSTTMTPSTTNPAAAFGAAAPGTRPGPEGGGLRMRPYEVMVILDAGLEEDAVRAVIDRATELIRSRGGTPGRVDRWGKRRFAYELKHRSEGYYVVMEITAEPAAMDELDRMFHLADEVI